MTLDELVLHDFGAYGGRQAVDLTPRDPSRPIILFGGLNGGGKTTLLDAIQLCLYGTFARTSNRGGLSYPNYLERSIHRGPGITDAAVELAFSQNVAGSLHTFRLHRSWRRTPSGTRESLELLRNGEPDDLATEHWSEQVEQFMPARIAQLFLFDGEKIEGYADVEGTSTLIATAIQNLLGLDIVEQLATDLKTMERRKRAVEAPAPEDEEAESLRVQIERLERERQELNRAGAAQVNELDKRRQKLASVEDEFRRRGGVLFERRSAIADTQAAAQREIAHLRAELRDAAAGAAPLAMVEPLLEAVRRRDEVAREAHHRSIAGSVIEKEHELFETLLVGLDAPEVDRIAARLRERRAALASDTDPTTAAAMLSDQARGQLQHLLTSGLEEERSRTAGVQTRLRRAIQRLGVAEDELAGVPSDEAIADLLQRRTEAQAALAEAEAQERRMADEVAAATARVEALRSRQEGLLDKATRREFERQDTRRILDHSRRARETLSKFRNAVVAKHVADIERLILASFRQLVGKGDLVSGVCIDPLTFALELKGKDGRVLTPERLSAGERQILAVAILWGLAKASGRPLPTVIDTPLGRLDSVHRRHLVERYFPVASHQVLLLSTDQEIVDANLQGLEGHVSRSYRLVHRQDAGRTVIEPGYFGVAA